LVAILIPSPAVFAQSLPDFSGTWRVEDSRNCSPNAISSPSERRGFTFQILQDATELSIVFPKLPEIVFKLDNSEKQYVHDSGDAWTKFRTAAKWDGVELTLKSTTLNGWWKDSSPGLVESQPTQLEETRILGFEAQGSRLRMETSSRDEKPFLVQYVDVLVKAAP
jgi:hypothetical protein